MLWIAFISAWLTESLVHAEEPIKPPVAQDTGGIEAEGWDGVIAVLRIVAPHSKEKSKRVAQDALLCYTHDNTGYHLDMWSEPGGWLRWATAKERPDGVPACAVLMDSGLVKGMLEAAIDTHEKGPQVRVPAGDRR